MQKNNFYKAQDKNIGISPNQPYSRGMHLTTANKSFFPEDGRRNSTRLAWDEVRSKIRKLIQKSFYHKIFTALNI